MLCPPWASNLFLYSNAKWRLLIVFRRSNGCFNLNKMFSRVPLSWQSTLHVGEAQRVMDIATLETSFLYSRVLKRGHPRKCLNFSLRVLSLSGFICGSGMTGRQEFTVSDNNTQRCSRPASRLPGEVPSSHQRCSRSLQLPQTAFLLLWQPSSPRHCPLSRWDLLASAIEYMCTTAAAPLTVEMGEYFNLFSPTLYACTCTFRGLIKLFEVRYQ